MSDLRDHPDARAGAAAPRIERLSVAGTTLHVEIRGVGSPILLIPGGAEDAEGWRPVAERVAGHTVVTYDRRGTLRSGRDDWPGGGSTQHADDAVALIVALGLEKVTVFGGSSGGVIALRLAQRHAGLIRRVLAYEPGFLHAVPDGSERHTAVLSTITRHLDEHPGDWIGAYDAFMRSSGLYELPDETDWFVMRERMNAEPFIRDDVPIISAESVDESTAAVGGIKIRLAHGTSAQPMFRDVTARLADIHGVTPDVIPGAGHALYLHPDEAAAYIARHAGP